jgi:hypothetical protein
VISDGRPVQEPEQAVSAKGSVAVVLMNAAGIVPAVLKWLVIRPVA